VHKAPSIASLGDWSQGKVTRGNWFRVKVGTQSDPVAGTCGRDLFLQQVARKAKTTTLVPAGTSRRDRSAEAFTQRVSSHKDSEICRDFNGFGKESNYFCFRLTGFILFGLIRIKTKFYPILLMLCRF